MTRGSSTNETVVVEGAERVYPCRCGETHRGEYAAHDYAHHNCLHQGALLRVDENVDPICRDCGRTFPIEEPS